MADHRPGSLIDILTLTANGHDRFLAPTPGEGPGRLFGGQVASQALRAATLTVGPDRRPHSLHSYFIRPGRPGIPLALAVERARDGRSFSTRRVEASQNGEPIFILDASFHIEEDGFEWQAAALPADLPLPDEAVGTLPAFHHMRSFDVRPLRAVEGFALHPCWVRINEPIDDDPLLHVCALAFLSDLAVVGSARAPGAPMAWGGASLDHAVWFHRQVRVDEWLLFSVEPVINAGARGFASGRFQRLDGSVVASLAQECLLRPASSGDEWRRGWEAARQAATDAGIAMPEPPPERPASPGSGTE